MSSKKNNKNLDISDVFISIVLYKCYHYHNVYWVTLNLFFHFIIQVPVEIIMKVLKNDFSRVYFIQVSLMTCFIFFNETVFAHQLIPHLLV